MRRVIPSLDTLDLDRACQLARAVGEMDEVYGFKLGFGLGLAHGLSRVVEALRRATAKPLIYDHQKAGTDIPDTAPLFARVVREAGVDEVILFPHSGPLVLKAWTEACAAQGLKVVVGGLMTHPSYLRSQGGYLADEAMAEIYREAFSLGVRAFVVPLTKPHELPTLLAGLPLDACQFYAPGWGAQGGSAQDVAFLPTLYLIVGRALLQAQDPAGLVKRLGGACET